jgi:uncharacterized membrane protein
MTSNREQILQWAEDGAFEEASHQERLNQALKLGDAEPSPSDWLELIKQGLVWASLVCFSVGVIFFFAYNWQDMSRFSKFALVEILILVATLSYVRLSHKPILGNAALLTLCLLTGGFLALVGQTYQTGADPWQLFAVWSLLILPLVMISRANSVWILWLALINFAITAYFDISNSLFGIAVTDTDKLWLFTLINSLLLIAFEVLRLEQLPLITRFLRDHDGVPIARSKHRYVHQLSATIAGVGVTVLAIDSIFGYRTNLTGLLFYGCWVSAAYYFYRHKQKDLLIISAGSLSAIVVAICVLVEILDNWLDDFGFLVISLSIVSLSTLVGIHLRNLSKEFNEPSPHSELANATSKTEGSL